MKKVSVEALEVLNTLRGIAQRSRTKDIHKSAVPWATAGTQVGELMHAGILESAGPLTLRVVDENAPPAPKPAPKPVPVPARRPAPALAQRPQPPAPKPKPVDFKDADLDAMSKDELYGVARKLEVDGRSNMSRAELIEALDELREASAEDGDEETWNDVTGDAGDNEDDAGDNEDDAGDNEDDEDEGEE